MRPATMSRMSRGFTSEDLRALNRVRLLRAVHDHGATVTRARLTELLGMARGTASVLVAELTDARLLAETPTRRHGRGRPSLIPGPHPDGPVALAVHLREDDWELAATELGGRTTTVGEFRHDNVPSTVYTSIGERLRHYHRHYGSRLIGVGISIAGPVRDGRFVHVSHPEWSQVDISPWLGDMDLPVRLANDATLAAIAEARRGRLRGVDLALHLHVDFGVGGCLVVDGKPLGGAHGVAGEFGHMRLTDDNAPCACGATGCWGGSVGVASMLRDYGVVADGGGGREQALSLLDRYASGDTKAADALTRNVNALSQGIGGLVNAHDPRLVTVSGLGARLLDIAGPRLRSAYTDALMRYHRADPPPILAARLGGHAPLVGAAELVFDDFLTPEGVKRFPM